MTLDLGIVSDEISPDLAEAVRHGRSWGISLYELRVLRTGRVPAIDPGEWREVVKRASQEGITVTALSPGIFKHVLSRKAEIETELREVLPRTMEMAAELGTRLVIVFGFQRESGESPDRENLFVDYMRRAADLAATAGIRLAVENEPGFWADSGSNSARLITRVGRENLGLNWDPCNGYGTNERPFPDGYEAAKSRIINVHVKDTKKGSLIECVPVGEGAIDWKGQVRALVRDKIVHHMTIETHCLPLIENSRKNVEVLRRYIEHAAGENT